MATAQSASWGVVFDMDGVLVDSADAHCRSWQLLGEEQGRPISREEFFRTFGRQNRDIIPEFFGPVTPPELGRLAERKEALYRDLVRERPPIVEGAVRLVRKLHETGAGLAVGSSGPRQNIELILQGLGVLDVPIEIVSSEDVSRGKPDPQVFQLACARLGLPPSGCVVIEDAPAGVQAAKAAGARCVAVMMHHPRELLGAADLIVERLADLTVQQLRSLAAG